jgi:hypothetical protein
MTSAMRKRSGTKMNCPGAHYTIHAFKPATTRKTPSHRESFIGAAVKTGVRHRADFQAPRKNNALFRLYMCCRLAGNGKSQVPIQDLLPQAHFLAEKLDSIPDGAVAAGEFGDVFGRGPHFLGGIGDGDRHADPSHYGKVR